MLFSSGRSDEEVKSYDCLCWNLHNANDFALIIPPLVEKNVSNSTDVICIGVWAGERGAAAPPPPKKNLGNLDFLGSKRNLGKANF